MANVSMRVDVSFSPLVYKKPLASGFYRYVLNIGKDV